MGMSRLRALFPVLVIVAVSGGVVLAQSAPPQTKPQASPAPVDEFLKGVYPDTTPGLVKPKVIREVKPRYTPAAMKAKIQGMVKLQIVVAADGSIARVRVLESLAPDLDNAAVEAAQKWEFAPAVLNDKPVPVALQLELEFRLH